MLDLVVHTFNPQTGYKGMYICEFEASLVCIEAYSWPGIHFEILSQKRNKKIRYVIFTLFGKVTRKIACIIVFKLGLI